MSDNINKIGYTLLMKCNVREFNQLRKDNPDWCPDLIGADLADIILVGVDLTGAKLMGANLGQATLKMARLARADLTGANLARANLRQIDLRDANLTRVNFERADLTMACLDWANLKGAHLEEVNLSGASLVGVNLAEATFIKANLTKAKGVIFIGPIGLCGEILYVIWHPKGPILKTERFWGTLAEFRKHLKKHHDVDDIQAIQEYQALIPVIRSWWKLHRFIREDKEVEL